jgi:hypothetical protein
LGKVLGNEIEGGENLEEGNGGKSYLVDWGVFVGVGVIEW